MKKKRASLPKMASMYQTQVVKSLFVRQSKLNVKAFSRCQSHDMIPVQSNFCTDCPDF